MIVFFVYNISVSLPKNILPKQKTELIEHIKSFIAHQIWFNEGFYEVMNSDDDVIKKAEEILKK